MKLTNILEKPRSVRWGMRIATGAGSTKTQTQQQEMRNARPRIIGPSLDLGGIEGNTKSPGLLVKNGIA